MNRNKLNRIKLRDGLRLIELEAYTNEYDEYWWDWSGINDDALDCDYFLHRKRYYGILGGFPISTQRKFPGFTTFINRSVEHKMDWAGLLIHPRVCTLMMVWLARTGER